MANTYKTKWTDIQVKLRSLSDRDLKGIIKELYNLNKETKNFLHAKFCNDKNLVELFKDRIAKYLAPHPNEWKPPQLAKAKKIIQDYKKATSDKNGTLDLMIHYYSLITKHQYQYGPSIYMDGPALVILKEILAILNLEKPESMKEQFNRVLLIKKKWDDGAELNELIKKLAPNLIS